ncbi:ATP-binding protein [Streptomyces alboflavus]|uniref:ATP-binding protein n=1 Tax=Streptomyces alboflavus TaxID=67267 RepID=UPI0036CC3CE6
MTSTHDALTAQASDAAIDTACRLLRLPTMRAQAADTIARAEREGLSYAGFLAELLMAECEDRDRRRAERRIRAARFPARSPCGSSTTRQTRRSTPQPSTPSPLRVDRQGLPAVTHRGLRRGKSHLLIVLGTAAAMAGYRVRYTTAAALVNELVEAADDKQLGKTITRYGRVDLLAIDELGYLELDRRGAEMLFQVLTERVEKNRKLPLNGVTLYTLEIPVRRWRASGRRRDVILERGRWKWLSMTSAPHPLRHRRPCAY